LVSPLLYLLTFKHSLPQPTYVGQVLGLGG
jgi:hypothetical protein